LLPKPNPNFAILIVFVVPFVEQYSLTAIGGGIVGFGEASTRGFEVFDANGNFLSSAVVTTGAPEPSALFLFLAGVGAFSFKRTTRRQT